MKKLVAIALVVFMVVGSAFALSVPGTDTGYINISGSKQIVSATVNMKYSISYVKNPNLYVRATGGTFNVVSESKYGFVVKLYPQIGKTMRFNWTASQKVYVLYK